LAAPRKSIQVQWMATLLAIALLSISSLQHILISLIKSNVIAKMKNIAVNRTQQSQM